MSKSNALRRGLGVLMIGASVIQGTHREFFKALVPKQIEKQNDQIQGVMTGLLAGIGVAFLIPKLRLVARWVTTAFLVGTLPAAVDQVRNPPKTLKDAGLPPQLVVARIPVQILVVVLTWVATRKPDATNAVVPIAVSNDERA